MVVQAGHHDAELVPFDLSASADRSMGCHAEVSSELLDEQGQLIDRLIGFAFDVLDARYLGVRVLPAETAADGPTSSRMGASSAALPGLVRLPDMAISM